MWEVKLETGHGEKFTPSAKIGDGQSIRFVIEKSESADASIQESKRSLEAALEKQGPAWLQGHAGSWWIDLQELKASNSVFMNEQWMTGVCDIEFNFPKIFEQSVVANQQKIKYVVQGKISPPFKSENFNQLILKKGARLCIKDPSTTQNPLWMNISSRRIEFSNGQPFEPLAHWPNELDRKIFFNNLEGPSAPFSRASVSVFPVNQPERNFRRMTKSQKEGLNHFLETGDAWVEAIDSQVRADATCGDIETRLKKIKYKLDSIVDSRLRNSLSPYINELDEVSRGESFLASTVLIGSLVEAALIIHLGAKPKTRFSGLIADAKNNVALMDLADDLEFIAKFRNLVHYERSRNTSFYPTGISVEQCLDALIKLLDKINFQGPQGAGEGNHS